MKRGGIDAWLDSLGLGRFNWNQERVSLINVPWTSARRSSLPPKGARELFMVESEQMQNGGPKVIERAGVLDRAAPKFIRRAVTDSVFESAAGS